MTAVPAIVQEALDAVAEISKRHGIAALDDFLESCRAFAQEKTLNIAVLGRFKAGKSSFLNHLLGRPLLPVGELPSMDRYRGIRFVDTPGLESVFGHNTDASLEWLPNVGLALVAVGVDPPLSQYDIELIRNPSRYTPNVSLLLTKVDLLDNRLSERALGAEISGNWTQGGAAVPLVFERTKK